MARGRLKGIGDYPELFLAITDRFARGVSSIEQIEMPSRNAAISTAHNFNRFKQTMARENHPQAEFAIDLMVRVTNLARPGVEGRYLLEFTARGLARLADSIKGKEIGVPEGKDGLPDLPGKADQGSDMLSASRSENLAQGENLPRDLTVEDEGLDDHDREIQKLLGGES